MDYQPKVFVSYSHSDKEFVDDLTEDLMKSGINVWIDKWEIQLGESLVQKIFLEGIEGSEFFLIFLSKNSVKSKWVSEELNAAIIKKIEGLTRLIPILIEKVDVPLPLKSLLWIDLSSNYDEGLRKLVQTIHGVSEKPPVGTVPSYVSSLKQSVGGLSPNASTVGSLLSSRIDEQFGKEKLYSGEKIHSMFSFMKPDEINDAVDELKEYGFIKEMRYLGTAPYDFGSISATYMLLLHFKDDLDYDPEDDIKSVAAAVVAQNQIDMKELNDMLKISPLRLNHVASFLEDQGYAKVIRTMGTAPYHFRTIIATRKTRQFVQNHCK